MKNTELKSIVNDIIKETFNVNNNNEKIAIILTNVSRHNFSNVILPSIFKNITSKGKEDFRILHNPPSFIVWDKDTRETIESILQGFGFELVKQDHPKYYWKGSKNSQLSIPKKFH